MKSIQQILQARLLGWLAVLVVLMGCGLFAVLAAVLKNQFDAGLEAKARLLALGIKPDAEGTIEADCAEHPPAEFSARRSHPDYFQIWSPDGQTFARSPSLAGGDLPQIGPTEAGRFEFSNLDLPSGRRGRMIAIRFVPLAEEDDPNAPPPRRLAAGAMLLGVATDRHSLDGALASIAAAVSGMGLLLGIGFVIGIRRVVGRGMHPLADVAARAATIDASSLDVRFPESGMPADVQIICQRLNQLLGRLEASFARERRFVNDVAHELRTPITELRSAAEVALKYPGPGPSCGHDFAEVLQIVVRMERMVANLLGLALCESGHQEVALESFDVAAVVTSAWRPFAAEAERRPIKVTIETQVNTVRSDPELLGAILTNLFSNAVAYTPAGGDIACTATSLDGRVQIAVSNTTDRLVDADLSHLFEPFWRKDASRNDRDHAGLGLALVAAFARLLGAEIGARLPTPGRFTITVSLPGADGENHLELAC